MPKAMADRGELRRREDDLNFGRNLSTLAEHPSVCNKQGAVVESVGQACAQQRVSFQNFQSSLSKAVLLQGSRDSEATASDGKPRALRTLWSCPSLQSRKVSLWLLGLLLAAFAKGQKQSQPQF